MKKFVDKLVEEYIKTIDEIEIASEIEHKNKCSFCTLYIVLFSILLIISIGIAVYFVYSRLYLKKMMLVLYLIPVLKQQFMKLVNETS